MANRKMCFLCNRIQGKDEVELTRIYTHGAYFYAHEACRETDHGKAWAKLAEEAAQQPVVDPPT